MQKIDLIKIYQRKTALVIDDFPDMRGSIRRMLLNFGIGQVDIAGSGPEAIALCEQRTFDIILCDYNLGDGKNGQQILEELRYRGLLKQTTIYMMITAETTKSMVFGALEYQPDDYLTKPFTQTLLQKRIDRQVLEKAALLSINQAMDQRDYARAIALCDEFIGSGHNEANRYEQRCHRLKAQCFLRRQEFAAARAIYEQVLGERALDWAQIGLGRCMMEMGELDRAESLFQQLIDQNCLCLEVYDYLAEIKSRKGDIAGAQRLLEHASDISPNAILRQQLLAEISQNNGDWERAEKAHRKVVRLGANSCYESPENYFNLARCIATQMRRDDSKNSRRLKDAEDVLERARRRYREDEHVRMQTELISASLHAYAGQAQEAQRIIAAAGAQIAGNAQIPAEVNLDLVRAYQALGERESAQRLLRELAERHADDEAIGDAVDRLSDEPLTRKGKEQAVLLNNRGRELLAAQEYRQAIALFSEALRHYPNNIAVKLNLLLALVREMGRTGAGANYLLRCDRIIDSIDTLPEEHPLHDRFHVLWNHVDKLHEQLHATAESGDD